MKEKSMRDLARVRVKYRNDRWKWVLNHLQNDSEKSVVLSSSDISTDNIRTTYGLEKIPKVLPCQKKCNHNPWCLVDVKANNNYKKKSRPIDLPRDHSKPIGLQNTANTCWINSAIQALFHLPKFRNMINEITDYESEECFASLVYILQALFVEMDVSCTKALACSPGSVFECLGLFATREIMKKDCDHEVLKCVSEFLENAIDTLMNDPRVAPRLGPLFNLTLTRVARWQCPNCNTCHQQQMAPVTCYTMAAYVSCEECPLDQCLLDLQMETQTGVTLVCGAGDSKGGCGASVNTERIVTPKIHSLPEFLIIRNNSLMDKDLKKRMHVVYPESLDLQNHMLTQQPATYSLAAVIFHHGYWSKHFTAHVCTNGKRWFNFNDEYVSELTSRNYTNSIPETHKNYLSNLNIAAKYKNRTGFRISKGAFIWLYVKNRGEGPSEGGNITVPPPDAIVEYVLQKQMERQNVNIQFLEKWKEERKELLGDLCVTDSNKGISLVSEGVLTSWLLCDQKQFSPQPSILTSILCKHRKICPRKSHLLRCVDTEKAESLKTHPLGIYIEDTTLPVFFGIDEGLCSECTTRYANHILFIERVKDLHKLAKKEAKKSHVGSTKFIGSLTLEHWPKYALNYYAKEYNIESEEEVEEETSEDSNKKIEEDSIPDNSDGCQLNSNILTTNNYNHKSNDDSIENNTNGCEIKNCDKVVATKIINNGNVEGNNNCLKSDINTVTEKSSSETNSILSDIDNFKDTKDNRTLNDDCDKNLAKETPQLDTNENQDATDAIAFNKDIVCHHNLLNPAVQIFHLPEHVMNKIMNLCQDSIHPATQVDGFDTCPDCSATLNASRQVCDDGRQQKKNLSNLFTERKRPHPTKDAGKPVFLLSREFLMEWKSYIRSCERSDPTTVTPPEIDNSLLLCEHNSLILPPDSDDSDAVVVWEEEWGQLVSLYPVKHVIHGSYNETGLLQTEPGLCTKGCMEKRIAENFEDQFDYNSEVIYVRQVNAVTDIPTRASRTTTNQQSEGPRKRQRLATTVPGSVRNTTAKLVRASSNFSSTDSLREVQNFIADRTGIWPMLQTLWLCPLDDTDDPTPRLLTDDHRGVTLGTLRIKPGDTVYFRAALEDMEKAAGDGIAEFNDFEEVA